MTPARQHRERMAALAATAADPQLVASSEKGGQFIPANIDRTPAQIYRERAAATAIVSAPVEAASPADRVAAQIVLRLTHDLRRLKEIRQRDRKVAAKREMLPEYAAWIEGLLAADAGVGTGIAAEVLPTYMVWLIDVGCYAEALDLVPFVLRHDVAMPARYQRDAPTVIMEEIADAALATQNAGNAFPLDILEHVDELTIGLDIHDEVRAKLLKAIGIEQLRAAEDLPADQAKASLEATLATLRTAQGHNDRIGVRDRIKRAEKLLAAVPTPVADTNTEQSGPAQAA
ncbi:phage P2 small terminase subunit gpM-like protein [Novosphingobium sp. Rr 2-17]|uniref:phage terminase small subunit n=1 Tax=Novosphingobium sp. Rr 2-17 TaxID=555793 RepID=UPI0002698591|nr:phage terminase small subunit [Novosphingobium sp. Rr 2-17]EIZ77757.1 phage P2 small terminase subunit gpM-like protein [Novosphingobium sp. Rr 2-17]